MRQNRQTFLGPTSYNNCWKAAVAVAALCFLDLAVTYRSLRAQASASAIFCVSTERRQAGS